MTETTNYEKSAHDECDFCSKPATHCYREGSGTGHSEHVCACQDHTENLDFGPIGNKLFR